ncbi:hypothetical protein M409DRAFT_50343 [Zasmidium cellare ATCC 36951]|uniref:F-box domain-containing protein n=1 Tax=Zasmidium cellare ATCC 36951 TaxID=1080233 RepID=A0A6A6D0S4_ZASCE|nr:uncharacterized protein M409DRAFT_50343 [Zasmidium cellare ATCC 36951]KAF2171679.1 hypothetical protein M409DRAFT_50343 [Zasmidium cellare ATCC 36951]
MRQSTEIAPGVCFNSPRWMLNPLAIPLNSAIPLASSSHLIPVAHDGRRYAHIPIPSPFKEPSRELKNLRSSRAWQRGGTREQQVAEMDRWFPNVSAGGTTTPCPAPEEEDVVMSELSINSPAAPTKADRDMSDCPMSDIGTLSKLPAEVRNQIYRLAVVEPESNPVKIEMQPKTCSLGTCLHNKASYNLPGIASTCKQLRWEVAPIFLVENTAFTFDDSVVQQCCVNNYIRTLGPFVDIIPQFDFLLKRPIWAHDTFLEYLTYNFTLTPPKGEDGVFALTQGEAGDRKICQCQLNRLVRHLNARQVKLSIGEWVKEFVDSDEFSDFVWRTRKTKQWTTHLPKCRRCGEVYFNN